MFEAHLQEPVFKKIAAAGAKLEMPLYLVGGYVRDLLLNRPCKDIDVVTVGDGIQLAEQFAKSLPGKPTVAVFKNFGTAQVKWQDLDIEFVGARKESYRSDSRKPEVSPGSLQDDQARRDFTINALAISLNQEDYGSLLDPFNGIQDLQDKLLRTPLDPDITFSDDPLRMMRAIRFATQLNFTIYPETLEAIQRNAERLDIISQERITDELNKIILSPVPSIGFKLLYDTRLLHRFFPELVALQGVETINGLSHKDNFYHTLQVLDQLALVSNDLWHRWAAILHDIAKPATKRFDPVEGWTFHGHEDRGSRMVPKIFRRLRLPLNEKMKLVEKLVLLHLRPIVLAKSTVTDAAVRRLLMEAGDDIEALMQLCRADITSNNERRVMKHLANMDLVDQKLLEVEEKDRLRNWQPPITGDMIIQTFNLKAGREVGLIKNAIREAILEGTVENTFESAYAFMLKKGEEFGLKPLNG